MSGLPRDPPDLPPRIKRLILGLVALTAVSGILGTALSPYLLVEHPLVLVGLNPLGRHFLLVANRVETWEAVAVGSLRRWVNFMATYGLGSLYGYTLITFLEKRGRWVRRIVKFLETVYVKLGIVLVIFVPVYSIAALAGVARLRYWKFALAIVPGQIAFVMGWLYFGNVIENWTDPLIDWLSRHVVEATAVAVGLVLLQQLYARHKKRNKQEGEPDLPL